LFPVKVKYRKEARVANPFANSVKFLLAVNLLASPRGTTVRGLMDELGISRRSVFRLLEALGELGFPLVDEQPRPQSEKTYRLIESYVLKLPNMAVPNPGFSKPELELLLSMLDFCMDIQKSDAATLLNSIRRKVIAMTPDGERKRRV
jgi:predicted DNA-binding transcriptional regulator YafY